MDYYRITTVRIFIFQYLLRQSLIYPNYRVQIYINIFKLQTFFLKYLSNTFLLTKKCKNIRQKYSGDSNMTVSAYIVILVREF